MTIPLAILVLATAIAAVCDARYRRIPNVLCAGLAFAGLASHLHEGVVATLFAAIAMLVAFLAGTMAFSAGWFGGGDVKLISAACALAGVPGSAALVLDILVAGALLALVVAALRGRLVALVRSTLAVARHGAPLEAVTLPYGIAIAAGSITYAVVTAVRS